MIGIPLGLLYSNAAEWWIHKNILHGVGKKKSSIWHFHWGEHHKNSRQSDCCDGQNAEPFFTWNGPKKETLSILGLMALHVPLFSVAPWFTATVWYSSLNYLYKHQKSHADADWCRKHMKHHYDHHMGRNQDANWCVTQPWFDHIMGTRIDYEYSNGRAAQRSTASASPSEQRVHPWIRMTESLFAKTLATDSVLPDPR